MSQKGSLFIGSSSEAHDYAYALQEALYRDFETTVWSYGVFSPSKGTLATLIDRARSSDFAALFLTPDDTSVVRGEFLHTPRDNLLFELGLFIGQLGVERVFWLCPNSGVDLPNDLHGITTLWYETDRHDGDHINALGPAANAIRRAAKSVGDRNASRLMTESRDASDSDISAELFDALLRLARIAETVHARMEFDAVEGGRRVVVTDRSGLRRSIGLHGDNTITRAIDELCEDLFQSAQSG